MMRLLHLALYFLSASAAPNPQYPSVIWNHITLGDIEIGCQYDAKRCRQSVSTDGQYLPTTCCPNPQGDYIRCTLDSTCAVLDDDCENKCKGGFTCCNNLMHACLKNDDMSSGACPDTDVNIYAPAPSPNIMGDPHLHGAYGGKADMRGHDGEYYNMLSSPNFALNMMISETDFLLPRQQVHGSFFTRAAFVMKPKDETMPTLKVLLRADKEGFEVHKEGEPAALFGKHVDFKVDEFSVHSEQVHLTVLTPDWQISIERKPIRSPLGSVKWRLDSSIKLLTPTTDLVVWPHGVLGQTWDGSGIAVDGKEDDYLHGGAEFTTSAQMEGAIEGKVDDYAVTTPFNTEFKYSRFAVTAATPPRDVSKLTGVKRTSNATVVSAGTTEEEEA